MAEVDPRILNRLAAAHQRMLTLVQTAAVAAATREWVTMGTLDEAEWERRLWAVVTSASRTIALTTRSYAQQQLDYTGVAPRLPQPDLSWMRDDFAVYANSPIARTTQLLATTGTPFNEAVASMRDHVSLIVDTAVRAAEQRTVEQLLQPYSPKPQSPLLPANQRLATVIVQQRDPVVKVDPEPIIYTYGGLRPDEYFRPETSEEAARIASDTGATPVTRLQYRRITQAGACGFCRVVADRLYTEAAALRASAWHASCRCTWRQATAQEVALWEPLMSETWETVIKEPADTSLT